MENALMRTRTRTFKFPRLLSGRMLLEIVVITLLLLGALSIILPSLWALSLSFGRTQEFFRLPPPIIPSAIRLDNYLEVFRRVPFGQFFLNSVFVTGVTTIGQLITCSMGAYAFARLNFPLKNILFILFLSALMIPIQITIIPIFILMRSLGLVNTLSALILPSLVNIFGVFLLRQFFETIPRDLEDAAKIDGAGYFRIYWQVILPLGRPALVALGILTFNSQWNNFFAPLIFITSPEKMTLPIGLTFLSGQQGVTSSGILMASVTLALIPVLVIFMVFQKRLVEGVTFTGLSGT